jgi:aspartate racemase
LKNERTVGVLGGMGPDATVDFMAKVIRLTPAERDQDHIRMLIDHDPKIPSRQKLSVADDARVREMLAAMAERLEAAGADFLVLVCNTAHGWLDRARQRVSIPFVNIIDETVRVIGARHPEVRCVGILATPACLELGLYQDALEHAGLTALPAEGADRRELMRLIDRVKAGDQSKAVANGMAAIARTLIEQGADAIIAGCTEIPLVLQPAQLTVPLINSTDELARRTVALALGEASLHSDHKH